MKLRRITALALALVMLLALAACGSKAPDDVSPSDEIGDIANTYAPDETPEATDEAEEPEQTAEPTTEPTPEPTTEPTPAPTPTPVPATPTPVPPTQAPVTTEPPAESTDAPSEGDGESVDLSAFYSSISSSYEFASLMDLDSAMLDAYYPGLTAITTLQLIAKVPMITASGHEIVLVQCENEDDAATVQSILAARKQSMIDGGAFYPATAELWQNAEICASGCYLMLVSHENAADIASSFYALFA